MQVDRSLLIGTAIGVLGLLAAAFQAGRNWGDDTRASASWWAPSTAHAAGIDDPGPQGRQPPRTVPSPGGPAQPPSSGTTGTSTPTSPPLVYETGSGSSAGANGVVAVTGSYGVGTSVLYVLDTERRQLAVYEARGGASSTRRLVFVGARRIDLDLRLEGYNDESEYTYDRLETLFDKRTTGARNTDPNGESGLRGR